MKNSLVCGEFKTKMRIRDKFLVKAKIKQTHFQNIPSGWGEQDEDWVEGLYFTRVDCVCNGYEYCECDGYENHLLDVEGQGEYPVDPETICQYSTLKDKNKKGIFEGDILRYNDTEYMVIKEYGAFGIVPKALLNAQLENESDKFIYLRELSWIYDCKDNCLDKVEVIGNSHDEEEIEE